MKKFKFFLLNLADINLADINLADINLADINLRDINLSDCPSCPLIEIRRAQTTEKHHGVYFSLDIKGRMSVAGMLFLRFSIHYFIFNLPNS